MINVALIGKGYWGRNLERYVRAHAEFKLVRLCDSRSDLTEIWRARDVHAVVIATPNPTHYGLAKEALLTGKHVFCEKPLALKSAECRELVQLAAENRLALVTNYVYTFSSALDVFRSSIHQGAIGELKGLELNIRKLGKFGREDVYWLLGSHLLAVLDLFLPLGNLRFTKKDILKQSGTVETGAIAFSGMGVKGQINVSLNHPWRETRIFGIGGRGTMLYDPQQASSLRCVTYDRQSLQTFARDWQIDEYHNLRLAIDFFSAVIRGKTESNMKRALRITEILEALHQ